MKFLVLMHPTPGANMTAMSAVLPAEVRHAWEMYKSGTARELYMRGDGKGAVLMLECADAAEAEHKCAELPLVKGGFARLDIIALAPFAPFESLFAKPAA